MKEDLNGLDTVIGQLAPNDSETFTVEYVITADDIGELENTATATAEADGELITQDTSVTVHVSTKTEASVDKLPNTLDKVVTWIQNPQTGDTTINSFVLLAVFVLAGSGIYIYIRKHRG